MTTKRYQIELTEEQLQVLREATEVYARLKSGQLFVVGEHAPLKKDVYPSHMDDILTPALKLIENVPFETCAWDMHQVIRHQLAWDNNPKGSFTVDFDPPLKRDKNPLITIKPIEVV